MDAEHHDLVLAITSHLPHLIAYTIVGTADELEDVTRVRSAQILGRRLSRLHPHRRVRSDHVARRVPEQQGRRAGDARRLPGRPVEADPRHSPRRRRRAVRALFAHPRHPPRHSEHRPGRREPRLRPPASGAGRRATGKARQRCASTGGRSGRSPRRPHPAAERLRRATRVVFSPSMPTAPSERPAPSRAPGFPGPNQLVERAHGPLDPLDFALARGGRASLRRALLQVSSRPSAGTTFSRPATTVCSSPSGVPSGVIPSDPDATTIRSPAATAAPGLDASVCVPGSRKRSATASAEVLQPGARACPSCRSASAGRRIQRSADPFVDVRTLSITDDAADPRDATTQLRPLHAANRAPVQPALVPATARRPPATYAAASRQAGDHCSAPCSIDDQRFLLALSVTVSGP